MTTLIFCRRLAESDVTDMPSVTCVDYVGDISMQVM